MNDLSLHHHLYERPAKAALPTILALHGTGGDERDLLPLVRQIAPGAGILSPRGNVSERGAPRFFRRLAEGVFDLEDLHRRTDELARWLDAAAETYTFDRTQVVALGFSNGANIAASLLVSGTPLAGAMLLRPMVPFQPETVPDLSGSAVLQLNGAADPIIPPREAEALTTLLRQSGAHLQAETLPTGHGLMTEDLRLAQTWWKNHLKRRFSLETK